MKNTKKKYSIGIDFGGTNIKIGLVSNKGKVIERRELATRSYRRRWDLIRAICNSVNEILDARGLIRREICGIGIGMPGLVDARRGFVYDLVNVKGWSSVPVGALLRKKLGIQIFVDNDANAMAVGEWHHGALRGVRNGVCITLGTGVGGGLIIDGRLYRGAHFAAGEIGHVTINEEGLRCGCGNRGCVEAYIGSRCIIASFGMTPKRLSELARKGNKFARGVWKDLGKHLGTALASVINIVDPDAIVIGGGVSNAGNEFYDSIKQEVAKRISYKSYRRFKILRSALGSQDAGVIGAASLVCER